MAKRIQHERQMLWTSRDLANRAREDHRAGSGSSAAGGGDSSANGLVWGASCSRRNPTSQGGAIKQDVDQAVTAFVSLAAGVPQVRIESYRQRMAALHAVLPDVLARITVRPYHGTEQEIADRVRKLLVDRYQIDPVAVQDVMNLYRARPLSGGY